MVTGMPNSLSYSSPHEKIHVYHNMLGSTTFEGIIKIIDDLDASSSDASPITKWNDWGSSSNNENNRYVFGQQKRFDLDKCKDSPAHLEIYNALSTPILEASNHYAEKHSLDIGQIAPLSLSRYFTDKFMGPHTDSHESDDRPTISVVFYLNDNYEGGELHFREQGVTIKPSSGDIVIFPSKVPFFHESKPVTYGTKYICPGFWNKL